MHLIIFQASPPTDYNQYLLKRSGSSGGTNPAAGSGMISLSSSSSSSSSVSSIGSSGDVNCDGHDELGCYTVRLYYDWFLIPGSCKCWKNDFFSQYINKK